MRAVAQLGVALNVSVIDVPVPNILNATYVIVKLNATAIYDSDLHNYYVASGSQNLPFLYGHEAVGVVSEIGDAVQYLNVGDYVIIPDNLDNGHFTVEHDTCYPPLGFGGLSDGSVLPGLQTGYTRIQFTDNSLIPVPVDSTANITTLIDYLFISDIFSTAWQGLTWSGFQPGDSRTYGAGPVGLLAAYSAILRGASQVYSIDHVQSRLDLAESIGAVPVNFGDSDSVEQIFTYEHEGVRRSVDAVGFEGIAANGTVDAGFVLRQAVNVTAQRGGIGILGLYNSSLSDFSIGSVCEKALRVEGGVVLPLQGVAQELATLVTSGKAKPGFIVSSIIDLEEAPEYFARFNQHEEIKVVIQL
ncbi:hypothetical protein LTR93_011602 [Exophiala xenobiotica]|nr:hypothetical protein LTR93_011602 [Exophiala xenobiotica]